MTIDITRTRRDIMVTTSQACLLAAYLLLGLTEGPSLRRYQASELHMGTQVTIVLYATDEEAANRAFQAAFARFGQLDQLLSDYRSDSELNRLSLSAPQTESSPLRPVRVGSDLWTVLQYAQQLSQSTAGAFDITVGPATRLWRRARRQRVMPKAERLETALSAIGHQHLRLDAEHRTATLLRPAMRLDLGAVAKGYATDQVLQQLRDLGIDHALVNAGGDMSLGRAPPGRGGWKIGVAPLEAGDKPSRVLLLELCGVATSGDAWQYVEIDGRRYSHIVDPRTGIGLTTRSSVTVVAADGMQADSLASAVSVLGPEKGLTLIDRTPGASALMVQVLNGQVQTRQSARFSDLPTVE